MSKKVESCIKRLLILEIVFSIILFLIIQLQMVAELWDQTFLDYMIEDWQRSPLVDIKALASQPGVGPSCPQHYKPIAYIKFPGTKAACKCSLDVSYDGECS